MSFSIMATSAPPPSFSSFVSSFSIMRMALDPLDNVSNVYYDGRALPHQNPVPSTCLVTFTERIDPSLILASYNGDSSKSGSYEPKYPL